MIKTLSLTCGTMSAHWPISTSQMMVAKETFFPMYPTAARVGSANVMNRYGASALIFIEFYDNKGAMHKDFPKLKKKNHPDISSWSL